MALVIGTYYGLYLPVLVNWFLNYNPVIKYYVYYILSFIFFLNALVRFQIFFKSRCMRLTHFAIQKVNREWTIAITNHLSWFNLKHTHLSFSFLFLATQMAFYSVYFTCISRVCG